MNVVWGALILVGAIAVAVTAMLLVRRRAPEGSFFEDGDRAAGVFGVLATGFSVLLGLVVFLAFTSYDNSRSASEDEARAVGQQVQTALLFPRPLADQLAGQLICYGRSVVSQEWPAMQAGTLADDSINPWAVRLFQTFSPFDPRTAREGSAYDKWLDERSDRENARGDRVHGAVGVIPTTLWVVLFLIAGIIFVFTLFFADSGERAVVQGLLMGSVVASIVSLMLLLHALDRPFTTDIGGLRPVAMERTLRQIDTTLGDLGRTVRPPCDAEGRPAGG